MQQTSCARCGYRTGGEESQCARSCPECGYQPITRSVAGRQSHLDASWSRKVRLGIRLLRLALWLVPLCAVGLLLLAVASGTARGSPQLGWLTAVAVSARWGLIAGVCCIGAIMWCGLLLLFAEDPFEDHLPSHGLMRGANAVAPPLLGLWVGFAEIDPGRIPSWALAGMASLLIAHSITVLAWCTKLRDRLEGAAWSELEPYRASHDPAFWVTVLAGGLALAFGVLRESGEIFRAIWIIWLIAIALATARVRRALP